MADLHATVTGVIDQPGFKPTALLTGPDEPAETLPLRDALSALGVQNPSAQQERMAEVVYLSNLFLSRSLLKRPGWCGCFASVGTFIRACLERWALASSACCRGLTSQNRLGLGCLQKLSVQLRLRVFWTLSKQGSLNLCTKPLI